ncbi:hypothetical protein MTO96_031287 [Rhipicephalus appendiculatus]
MAAESPPSSATPFERPRRSLIHTSSHRRSQSVACSRMLWNLIASANATQLRHEQVQRLCKVVGEKPTALQLPVPAADAEETAGCLVSSGDPFGMVNAAVTSNTSAVLERALPGVPGIVGGSMSSPALAADSVASAAAPSLPCTHASDPRNVPLPVDSEPDPDDMDTTSARKRSRPSESGSDDEGASRKMQAIAAERLTAMSPTKPLSDAVAEEHFATRDADVTSETEFRLVLSKSQKRRQQSSTPLRTVATIGPPSGNAPAATPAAHPSTARDVPGLAEPSTATQAAATRVPAAANTTLPSATSPLDSGTVLFRPANAGRIQPTPQNASCGKESGAWPPSRRPLPPTCLIARLKQPCVQALAGRVVLT